MKTMSKWIINIPNEFIQWFRGFTDAEGCFLIVKTGNSFAFRFTIKLHKDDLTLLNYIKSSLGDIGNIATEGSLAYFKVTSISEIRSIIEIFSIYPLNSSKHLDFLAFREAYLLYTSLDRKSKSLQNVLQKIDSLKESMNSKRTNFNIPAQATKESEYKIHITDQWLLGFIEGDGSFSITKDKFTLIFSISQRGNLALMEAIRNYLSNLANCNTEHLKKMNIEDAETFNSNVIYLTKSRNKNTNLSEATEFNYVLIIKSEIFINKVLIPYLDSLTFHSKKKLDYLDWKTISQIRNLGLHYLPGGKKLIELIKNQMNNKRLSNSGNKKASRYYINSEVSRLLNEAPNYETVDGKIFIRSLNKFHNSRNKIQVKLCDGEGIVFQTFHSLNQCAEFVGVSAHTVSKKMKTSVPIEYNSKEFWIVKSKRAIA